MIAKRCLVTGATGFVGANLARRLLADGHDVTLAVRKGHATWRLSGIESDLRLSVVDLTDPTDADRCIAEARPDWVFHLAAYGAYSTQKDVQQIVRVNFNSTVNLVEAALKAGFEAFINAGSSSEYGFKNAAPAEDEWIEPNSHYAVTKAAATLYCRHAAQSRGARITTLRLYSIYGPWEEPTRLIPNLVTRGLNGALPPLANPAIARDFVEVSDCCEAFVLAAARAGQPHGSVYNVGSGRQVTLGEAVEAAREVFKIDAVPNWGTMPDRSWDTKCWVSDSSRIKSELGWEAATSFRDGLAAMGQWLQSDPARLAFYQQRLASAGPA